jgi:cytoskeletal protein CcmA (bactofilin family)
MSLVCDLFVDGIFDGNIQSHKSVTVGKNGKIKGEVHAHSIIVQGVVEGMLDAERIEIKEAGRVKGSVISSELVIEAKGIFEGESKIKGGELKIPAPKEQPANKIAAGA